MHCALLCRLLCFTVAVSGAAISIFDNQQPGNGNSVEGMISSGLERYYDYAHHRCGLLTDTNPQVIASCPPNDATFGQCCGPNFICGSTWEFCNPDVCKSDYGTCGQPKSNNCGIFASLSKCADGTCCGSYGTCGLGDAFCSLVNGCQPYYGSCYPEAQSSAIFDGGVSLYENLDGGSAIYEPLVL